MFRCQPREIGLRGNSKKFENQNKPMYIYVHTYKNTEKSIFHEYTIFNFPLRDYLTQIKIHIK